MTDASGQQPAQSAQSELSALTKRIELYKSKVTAIQEVTLLQVMTSMSKCESLSGFAGHPSGDSSGGKRLSLSEEGDSRRAVIAKVMSSLDDPIALTIIGTSVMSTIIDHSLSLIHI